MGVQDSHTCWVIQKDTFSENEDKLVSILGDRIIWCEHHIDGTTFSRDPGEGFIFYGSIVLGRRLQSSHKAICWLYDHAYDCTHYLPKFHKFALNNPHIFIEAGGLKRLQQDVLGETKYFIKENSGYKYFTGAIHDKYLQADLDKVFDEELLLLAPIKKIGAEWRFVILSNEIDDIPHKIITHSLYGEIQSEINPYHFVDRILTDPKICSYQPAPMWTLDICETETGFAVVEVNCLLAAGWYDCDIAKIVENVDLVVGLE